MCESGMGGGVWVCESGMGGGVWVCESGMGGGVWVCEGGQWRWKGCECARVSGVCEDRPKEKGACVCQNGECDV